MARPSVTFRQERRAIAKRLRKAVNKPQSLGDFWRSIPQTAVKMTKTRKA